MEVLENTEEGLIQRECKLHRRLHIATDQGGEQRIPRGRIVNSSFDSFS